MIRKNPRRFAWPSLLLLLSVSIFAGVPAAPNVAAADYGAGQVLTAKVAYGPNEPIYASGAAIFTPDCDKRPQAGGVNDIFQTWSDLYIVPTGSVTAGGALADVSGAPNVIRGGIAGGFVEQLIGATGPGGNIGAGVYDIVLDECQDGTFDAEDTRISAAFRVTIPIGTAPAVIAGLDKGRAADLAGDYALIEKAWGALLKAAGRKPAGVSGPVSYSSDLSVTMFQVMTQTVLPDPRPAAAAAITQLKRGYQGMAADPPDLDFAAHAALRIDGVDGPGTSVGASRLNTPEENAVLDVSRSAEVDAALLQALVASVEKHQGAAQVGDGDWMAQHARQALALIDVIEARASITPDLLDDLAATWISPAGRGWRTWSEHLLRRSRNFDESGPNFNNDQRDGRNRGLTLEEITLAMATDMEAASDTGNLLTNGQRLHDELRAMAARQRTAAAGYGALRTELARAIAGVEAEDRDAPRPIVDAGGPYAASTGTPITLDGSASTASAGSTLTSWAWDLDLDGDFDDATGATPTVTFDVAGDRVVAVEVTDASGADAIGFATVSVAVGDRAPVIESASPDRATVEVDSGEAFSLGVVATDPEGGPVTVSWYRNGVALGATGSTYDGVGQAEVGSVQYEAVAADAAGNRSSWPFVVTVFAPDGDGDGWRANADCDDTDALVNAGRAEITGNGKDDDCNPETTDDPTAPRSINLSRDADVTPYMAITEGDVVAFKTTGWIHPSRYSGQPFPYTMDWGDGTVTTGTAAGTNYDDTVIRVEHVYRTSGMRQPVLCITAPDGLTGCSNPSIYTVGKVFPSPPVVHPADLRTWAPESAGRTGEFGVSNIGAKWLVGEGGHSASEEINVNFPTVLLSDKPLDTSSGSGRVAFDVGSASGGDDDWFGLALGLDPGEINDDDADWMAVRLGRHLESKSNAYHCGGTNTATDEVDPASLARFRGYGAWSEYGLLQTFAIPDATDPLCNDSAGAEVLASTKLPVPLGNDPNGFWKVLVHPSDSSAFNRTQLYHIEVEYSPSEVSVWIDGVLIFHVEAPADDPFPQGHYGLFVHSQAYTRVVGHEQVPVEQVVQGSEEEFSAVFASADLTGGHTAVIDWGDGLPASQGIITEVPGKPGFWTVTASHAYPTVGQFQANVCVTDSVDGQVGCGIITVDVENAAPVVDAGSDATTLSKFALSGAHLSDPGVFDTHTVTVDWGDGSPIEPATLTGRPGSLIIDAEHDYATAGTYTIEVCGTDEPGLAPDGGSGLTASKPPADRDAVALTTCDTATATVLAALAVPDTLVDEDRAIDEGDVVAFGVGYAEATRGARHTVTVDWGDGSPAEAVAVQSDGSYAAGWGSHRFDDDGVYEVTVTTTSRWTPPIPGAEERSSSSTRTATVTVGNLAPQVEAGRDRLSSGTVVLEADSTYQDPGASDTHTATVDWGDGSPVESAGVVPDPAEPGSGRLTGTHTYADDGTYTVTVTVTDDDGASGSDTFAVTVSADAPPLHIGLPEGIDGDEGTPVALPVTVTLDAVGPAGGPDPGEPGGPQARAIDPSEVTASIDWGDGSAAEPVSLDEDSGRLVASSTHRYSDDGIYGIIVSVCVPVVDDEGVATDVCDTAATTAAIANLDPVITDLQGDVAPGDGLDVTVTGSYSDPGSDDTHVAVIDWGDGSPDETMALGDGTLSASHRYDADGDYSVGVCVTDDDQGQHCRTVTLSVVQEVPPTTTTTTTTLPPATTAPPPVPSTAPPTTLTDPSTPTTAPPAADHAAIVHDDTSARAHRTSGSDDTTLARTGPTVPIPLASGIGLLLVLLGAAVVLGAGRRGRRRRL